MNNTISKLFSEFTDNEKSAGIILIFVTIISILIANSGWGDSYIHFWHAPVLNQSVEYWINDGLMTIFFLLVGLEIEREVYIGELSTLKKAALPVFAAIGGMVVPCLVYIFFNLNYSFSGAAIPMATDIAFALGVLSLAGNRVPISLKVFLTALAVIDDLGAIVVIAVFYSKDFSVAYFSMAMGVFLLLLLFNRLKIYRLWLYLIPGVFMWYFMLQSGVHATISGVLLAFAIPFEGGGEDSISYKLQHFLHKIVAFGILPLFALANTGIKISLDTLSELKTNNSLGIIFGLLLGKPIGIMLACWSTCKFQICELPENLKLKQFTGIGFLAGIGFTMSIFITILAFDHAEIIQVSKIAILMASMVSGLVGYLILKLTRFQKVKESE